MIDIHALRKNKHIRFENKYVYGEVRVDPIFTYHGEIVSFSISLCDKTFTTGILRIGLFVTEDAVQTDHGKKWTKADDISIFLNDLVFAPDNSIYTYKQKLDEDTVNFLKETIETLWKDIDHIYGKE